MRKIGLTILLFVFVFAVLAQDPSSDNRLARQYFQDKEFDKASVLYDKIYKSTGSIIYFSQYLRCLVELNDYKTAEKAVKKQIKKNSSILSFIVELGYIYKSQGNEELAAEQFELAVKKLLPQKSQATDLANAFKQKREFDYAEKVYLKARKQLRGKEDFHLELADVYRYKRDYGGMINEFLDLLEKNEMFASTVQNRLLNIGDYENDEGPNNLLKNSLLERIQKNPGKIIFSELLIWQYIQEKDFASAMKQEIALDKRFNEKGSRLLELGKLAVSNKDYKVAVDAFKYVTEQGENSPYYRSAKGEYMLALYNKIINSRYTNSELIELETNFITTLEDIGENKETFSLIKDLCHLQAFYLNKGPEATERLENTLKIPGLDRIQLASCKIELGDIYLLTDDIYEATLYYAQVEKSNKSNPIGYEAQLRKSKLAYYSGNFKWAQAQLDVLKASTSKLIANDAFELSQLIQDNTVLDTTMIPMAKFAHADLLMFQNKDSLAMLSFDSILENYTSHSLADEILYRKARYMQRMGNYTKAAEYLQEIIDKYSYDILGDDATFYLASIYELKLNDKVKAQELYKKLLFDYPGSIYTVDARKKFRMLRGEALDDDEKFFYGVDINP